MTDPTAAPVGDDARWDHLWDDVVGQDHAVAQLRAAAVRPVHAYLLVGPVGSGKRAAAVAFAAELLGRDAVARGDDPNRGAALALAESHPDVRIFSPTGAALSVDDAREITTAASRSPVEGDRKVLVLTEFEKVAQAGPALLKTIEEPPESTVFVILAEEIPNELVAIASRSVRIDLARVPDDVVVTRLQALGIAHDVAVDAAAASGGDLGRARLLAADGSLAVRRAAWHSIPTRLDGTGAVAAELVDEVVAHVDESQAALDERHRADIEAADERAETYGSRDESAKDVTARHKREIRRHRNAEVRFGLATMAAAWREHLTGPDADVALDALEAIDAAAETLVRNPQELLLLQALVSGFQPLSVRR